MYEQCVYCGMPGGNSEAHPP
eukprot:COSAG02_NODE_66354_length_255_cov_1.275641_1_plen_20_part_10